jgi:hypothetical protein
MNRLRTEKPPWSSVQRCSKLFSSETAVERPAVSEVGKAEVRGSAIWCGKPALERWSEDEGYF